MMGRAPRLLLYAALVLIVCIVIIISLQPNIVTQLGQRPLAPAVESRMDGEPRVVALSTSPTAAVPVSATGTDASWSEGDSESEAPSPPTATLTTVATTAASVSQEPAGQLETSASVPIYGYEVIQAYPHDPNAFTQGLIFHDGFLYEGTGLRGASTLRKVELETGRVVRQIELANQYFGEGIVLFEGRIFQLTWRSRLAFVYDFDTFAEVGKFRYETEGWGLTHDGTHLIMSDGSNVLTIREPATFKVVRRLAVNDGATAIARLNELEYVDGEVLANVWQTNRIAQIDLDTGLVVGWIDLSGVLSSADRTGKEDVLNGIAYDAAGQRLFVTGKRWPKLFEIRLVPQ